jgi:hypothetical protein
MENPALSKYTAPFGLSLAVASIVNGLLVVAKEKSPAVMSGMKSLTGHHWITHSAIVILLFFVLGWILAQGKGGRVAKMTIHRLIGVMAASIALGSLIIVGFYLIGD